MPRRADLQIRPADPMSPAAQRLVELAGQLRGRGIARAIMNNLEVRLHNEEIGIARPETGVRQPGALGLYRRLRYVERAPFGHYREDPLSVFMEKRLA